MISWFGLILALSFCFKSNNLASIPEFYTHTHTPKKKRKRDHDAYI